MLRAQNPAPPVQTRPRTTTSNPVSRRHFLQLGAAGIAAAGITPRVSAAVADDPALAKAIADASKRYLTPQGEFQTVERGTPIPYTIPLEKRLEVGIERDTWQLEVLADPTSNSKLQHPLSKERNPALNFEALMKLAETKAVRYLKVISCNNIFNPLGIGLWEGVPLRDVLWLAKPVENIRHVYYYGYHNDDPKQMFQCWQPINRILEDPPGELPVMLCYKINGEWLTGKRGGPVRMLVPESYGFKSVKWITHVFLTNKHQSDDTYANGNNDTHSWLKTFARFGNMPAKVKAGEPLAINGQAQVGMSGLSKVQWCVTAADAKWPEDDPNFTTAPWQDAQILPLPDNWAGGIETGKLHPVQFDPATSKPREWPMRYTLCNWVALLRDVKPGKYELRCRTVDIAGHAQPMPRPFLKSGRNMIQKLSLTVEV